MTIQTEKLFRSETILQAKNSSFIKKRKKVISKKAMEDDEEWNLMSVAEKASIENGLKSLDEGNKIPLSEIKKEYSKYLSK